MLTRYLKLNINYNRQRSVIKKICNTKTVTIHNNIIMLLSRPMSHQLAVSSVSHNNYTTNAKGTENGMQPMKIGWPLYQIEKIYSPLEYRQHT